MDRVYLVMGSSGEYSDWSEWCVRAFDSVAEANEYVAACEAASKRRPKYPDWLGNSQQDVWTRRRDAWQVRVRAFIATSPDDRMPERDPVDYAVVTVPFGLESTALATAPPRLGNRQRAYDLTTENEP